MVMPLYVARVFRRALTGAAAGAAAAWAMSRVGSSDDRDSEMVAQRAAAHLVRRTLTRAELNRAIPIVRYGLGAAVGAMYAVAVQPRHSGIGAGALVGVSLWACAELSRGPAATAAGRWTDSSARESFASHIVYGVTLDVVQRRFSRLIR